MRRFSSLKYNPAETRRLLRDRFARYLPSRPRSTIQAAKGATLGDESLLHFLLNLTINFESDFERARATYAAALPPNSSEPPLEDLVKAGWVRVIWKRISTPFEIAQAGKTASAGMTAFASMLAKRYEQAYRLTDAARSSADLVAVVAAIERGNLVPRDIGCQSPEWVAARLWDRSLTDSGDLSEELRVWVDRWAQLGSPWFIPKRVWSETGADAFRDASLDVIRTEPTLSDWGKVRARVVNQIALAAQSPPSDAETHVPAVPSTVFDRAVWLNSRKLERPMFWALEACGVRSGEKEHHFCRCDEQRPIGGDAVKNSIVVSKCFAILAFLF